MKANPVFSLYIPTKLVFGCGEIKKLSSEKLPGKKALVVISSGTSMRKYGYLERVLAQLRLNNVETLVYDKILPNPIKEHVMEAGRHLPGGKVRLCSRTGRRKFHRLSQKYSCYGLQRW